MNPTDLANLTEELDRALERMSAGVPLDDLLAEQPVLAGQLRLLLAAASAVDRAVEGPSPERRRRARTVLLRGMRAHDDMATSRPSLRRRLALGMAAAALSFAGVGTAAAQTALPGDSLFGWKLAAEEMWRSVSPDRLQTDMALLDRRTEEWIRVHGAPQATEAGERFRDQVERLSAYRDPAARASIDEALHDTFDRLVDAGVLSEPPNPSDFLGPQWIPLPSPSEVEEGPQLPLPTLDLVP